MSPLKIYFLSLVVGLLLFGLELFVPGGILGVIGGVLLLVAVILGFKSEVFGPQGGMVSAVVILAGLCAYIVLILKLFPHTPIGRRLTLSNDMKDSKAADHEDLLMDQVGEAHTDLRPAGIALIDSRRVDVVAEGDWIASGSPVRVVQVEGNRVVVRGLAS